MGIFENRNCKFCTDKIDYIEHFFWSCGKIKIKKWRRKSRELHPWRLELEIVPSWLPYGHPYQNQNQNKQKKQKKKVFLFYQALLTTGATPVTALPPVFNHLPSSRVATSASATE